MSRLSIRVQITLAFTVAMAVVLAVFGAFIFIQTRDQLDESVDDGLEVRTADVATNLGNFDAKGPDLAFQELDPEDGFVQVVSTDGEIVYSTSQLTEPALAPSALSDLDEDGERIDLRSLEGIDGRVRVLATPSVVDGREVNTLVGATLEDRDESVRNLGLLLAIGGPLALGLAAFGGYWVAGRALDPLEQGYERERRFVDDASHELRTPLALHKAELEVALRYADDETALRSAIASGIEEVDRLAQLADDLLVVARSGEGGLALTTEEIDSAELLETVASRFESRTRSSNRSLAVESEPGLVIQADRLRIEQALTNLVENAIRHGAGRIELSAEQSGDGVKLRVRDEGMGFDEDFRDRAFERFSRGDAARGRGGTGLGLAIVETIAAAHGGSAGITGGNVGGEVWIELPRLGLSFPFHRPRV